ncbi:midnolin isoform X2 [Oryzias melastigma]|uniref:Midnolin-like n=1 Tax=Oryzias melastigma TaxID=30732 RepID=A0A3B3DYY5_ORYME|nr:midnolin isoform X2 [Oryzias melastigma]
MDTLESLSDTQMEDFLSGRSSLTLTVGLGAHTMHVQLQLSAQDVKKLQQDRDSMPLCGSEHRTDTPASGSDHSPCRRSSTSQTSSPALLQTDLTSSIQCTQRLNRSLNPPDRTPPGSLHGPSSEFQSCSAPSLPSLVPFASCLVGSAPVCSAGLGGSDPRPQSPRPASTVSEVGVNGKESQSGAVIETLVNDCPGVVSGTFSGTLSSCSQSHPRRGVAIILQILNDLLIAAHRHQRALTPPFPPNPAVGQLATEEAHKKRKKLSAKQRMWHHGAESRPLNSLTEENQTMHCKLERLQLLMRQRRLRRRTRRNSHLNQTTCWYPHHRS